MATPNLYEELKRVLQEFRDFLAENVSTIAPAVSAVAGLVPQLNQVIDQLISLLNQLKTEINELDLGEVGDKITEALGFINRVDALMDALEPLLPDQQELIDQIQDGLSVATSVPTLDQFKAEIVALIDEIVDPHLKSLKAAA